MKLLLVLAITWGGLQNYQNLARGYCARRRQRVLGGHPLDAQVFQEFLQLATAHAPGIGLNVIRLLKALVAAGASSRAPMDSDWVHDIALRNSSLQVTDLASAITCAERERWLADSRAREDWIYLTPTGENVAKVP